MGQQRQLLPTLEMQTSISASREDFCNDTGLGEIKQQKEVR